VRQLPPIRYTKVQGESIAYRDCGGPGQPLVYLGTNGSHQDLIWDEPGYAHFLGNLMELGRLVSFDRRGSGLSSHTTKPTIDARTADVVAVLDAVGADAAVLIGSVGSSQAALAFAATHPDRCRALVLFAPSARMSRAPGYDAGYPGELVQLAIDAAESAWGTGVTAPLYTPSLVDDVGFVAWVAKMERSSATPVEAREWVQMYIGTDVRDVLPHVSAPVLVAIPSDAEEYVTAQSRFVADHLPNARAIEIPGRDLWPFGDGMEPFLAAVTGFLAEVVHLELTASSNRRLAAVLFTDIVSSTEQLQAAGDRRWRATLESHDEIAGHVVARRGGRVVKTTGDGTVAVFDGPASAVLTALEFISAVKRIGLSVRAGVHVGELEERGDDIAGIAVHLASRIADRAEPGEVLVTTTVRDLVAGSGLRFEERGVHHMKGIREPAVLLAASLAEHP
jgi:class 3 adenylate cyclase/pimeloyl-ACP methyl ester carboxylesterase